MEFTWLLILCGLVVIPVVFISEPDHVEGALAPRSRRIGTSWETHCEEPGGTLKYPY